MEEMGSSTAASRPAGAAGLPDLGTFSAGLRLVVGLLITLLIVDAPALGGGPPVAVIMLPYLLIALAVMLHRLHRGPQVSRLIDTLPYWIDVTWAGLILQLLPQHATLFALAMVQPVIMLGIVRGTGTGVLLALYAACWLLLRVELHRDLPVAIEAARTVHAFAVLALVPMAAVVAQPLAVLRQRLSLTQALDDEMDARRGLAATTRRVATLIRLRFDVDLVVVLPADLAMPAAQADLDGDAVLPREVQQQLVALLDGLGQPARLDIEATPWLPRGWRAGLALIDDHAAQMPALADALDMRAVAAVPLRRFGIVRGHLLLARRDAPIRRIELLALQQAQPEVVRTIEHALLVDQLIHATSARERARLGRDLHDSAIQPYVGLAYALDAACQRVDPSNPARAEMDQLSLLARRELESLREIVGQLRRGHDTGDDALLPAVRRQVRHFQQLFGLVIDVHVPPDLRTSRALAGAVFHWLNEALNNLRKHTPARRVEVRIERDAGRLLLRVRDDAGSVLGHPLPPFRPRSLAERAAEWGAELTITQPDGLNTELTIAVPLQHDTHDTHDAPQPPPAAGSETQPARASTPRPDVDARPDRGLDAGDFHAILGGRASVETPVPLTMPARPGAGSLGGLAPRLLGAAGAP